MRRSICQSEPNIALAGDARTWKFSYTTSVALPAGTKLKFDPLIQYKPVDWELPDPANKTKNTVWAQMPNGKTLQARLLSLSPPYTEAYEFVLTSEVKAGETFSIFIGAPDGTEKNANRSQTVLQRRRPFHLYIDPKGKGDYKDPEVFAIDVRGNKLHRIRIIAPSLVSKNRRFDVLVRFEDVYGNLTNMAPQGMLIELSYEHLRENLTWKLFVPETGFILLPNLYFNEQGVYRIQLRSASQEMVFHSPPIKCLADTDRNIYWGLLHGESERVDSGENVETYLRYMRDENSLQFVGTSNFESIEETSNEVWKTISAQVAEHNEESRFTAMLGMQWFGEPGTEGLRNFVYWKDNKPILRHKDTKSNILKKIYKTHTPKELLSIPCFTMAKGFETTFDEYQNEFERVVEIYNAWGSSECTAKEGNPRPITCNGKTGISETEKGSIRAALNRNMRFGFVAGGLDDRGIYSGLYSDDQVQYSPGLTAILAIEQTRDTLMQTLYNRSCYATTGARIVVGFFIAGSQMGTELTTKLKPGLAFNRHITGYICGTAPITEIEIIRNGKVFTTLYPNATETEFALDDSDELGKIALTSPDERPPFAYYYLRVTQKDGHIAWSSPIWVDLTEAISPSMVKKTVIKKK